MKIMELSLRAFGPFTDRVLDLSRGQEGLHVIYGPNEAGKSSALRGLVTLLYGFPERTGDDFVHHRRQLRLEGRLQRKDGEEIAFSRLKKRKNALRTLEDDQPLDPSELSRFTGGLSMGSFTTLFGIDHERLVAGGQAILEQRGEVGRALFTAALGTASFQRIAEELEKSADSLFLPRGSKPHLNRATAELKQAQLAVVEASLPRARWSELRRAEEGLQAELGENHQQLAECLGRKIRLERLQRVLPMLAERRQVLEQLDQLGEVAALPDGFPEQRRALLQERGSLLLTRSEAERRLDRAREELDELSVSAEVLQHASAIERLHRRLSAYATAVDQRPASHGRRAQLLHDAQRALGLIRPERRLEEFDGLRAALSRRRWINEQIRRHHEITADDRNIRQSVQEQTVLVQEIRDSLRVLPRGPRPVDLKAAVSVARREGELDRKLAQAEQLAVEARESCGLAFRRLDLWQGSLEELVEAPLPSTATLERFEVELNELSRRRRELEAQLTRSAEDQAAAEQELEILGRQSRVLTEQDLIAARTLRDRGWSLLKQQWVLQADCAQDARIYADSGEVHVAFERHLEAADEIADRLREDAERVHRHSSLQERIDGCGLLQRRLAPQLEDAFRSFEEAEVTWRGVWSGLGFDPLSPREMISWRRMAEEVRDLAVNASQAAAHCARLRKCRAGRRDDLRQQLEALDGPLMATMGGEEIEPLIQYCEEVSDRLESQHLERGELKRALKQARQRLASFEERSAAVARARAEWQSGWDQTTSALGLGGDLSPVQMLELLEQIAAVNDQVEAMEELDRKIGAMDQEIHDFEGEVSALWRALGRCEDQVMPPEVRVETISEELTRSQQAQAERRRLEEQVLGLRRDIEAREHALVALGDELNQMQARAQVRTEAELEQAEQRWASAQELALRLERVTRSAVRAGEGQSIEELEQQARQMNAEELAEELAGESLRLRELEEGREHLREQKGRLESELERMDGGEEAAAAEDRVQGIIAAMRADAESYLRLRIARAMLQQEVERYRAEHQGALLARASEIFAALTGGSFSGLRADLDPGDRLILLGVRSEDQEVDIEGMSTGTRDQLFLSLRLATLEQHIRDSEPMPFIVDDVLINFDDERALATLEILGRLALMTQVLVFTHHQQVVQLARGIEVDAGLFIHDLP